MKLITLGCSLTHQAGWADYIAECTKLPLINLAQSAGSNQIQQHRFKEYLLTDKISKDDLIIWQITSTYRKHDRIKLTNKWRAKLAKELYAPDIIKRQPKFHHTITQKNKNIFDNKARIDFLCTTDYIENPTDEEQLIEDLLFNLIIAKKFTENLLVVFGWGQVLPSQYIQKFKKLLSLNDIEYIEDTIVEWCEAHHLPMAGSLHPTHRSYQLYGEKVIMPKINSILDANFNIIPAWLK